VNTPYWDGKLGSTLFHVVQSRDPLVAIEFGTLYGYTASLIGRALRRGHLTTYDLFGWNFKREYPSHFLRSRKWVIERSLARQGLADKITVKKGDFWEWMKAPTPFDFLWVDIGPIDPDFLLPLRGKGLVMFEVFGSAEIL